MQDPEYKEPEQTREFKTESDFGKILRETVPIDFDKIEQQANARAQSQPAHPHQRYQPVRGFSEDEYAQHQKDLAMMEAVMDGLPGEIISKHRLGDIPLYDVRFYVNELQIMSGKLNLIKDAIATDATPKNRRERLDKAREVLSGTYLLDGDVEPLSKTEAVMSRAKGLLRKVFKAA